MNTVFIGQNKNITQREDQIQDPRRLIERTNSSVRSAEYSNRKSYSTRYRTGISIRFNVWEYTALIVFEKGRGGGETNSEASSLANGSSLGTRRGAYRHPWLTKMIWKEVTHK